MLHEGLSLVVAEEAGHDGALEGAFSWQAESYFEFWLCT